jgi:hypothetical protein
MRPVNRRTKASIARYNERSKVIDAKNEDRSITRMIQQYSPKNTPIDPFPITPAPYETTIITYVDKNSVDLLPSFLEKVSGNILIVNDSGKKIEDDRVIDTEFRLGVAGGLNYAISIAETPYITFMSVDDPFEPPEECQDVCLIGSPGSISELWKTRLIPKILAMSSDAARKVGFNWDISDEGIAIKEFIYHVAVQFAVTYQDYPPYKTESHQKESFEFRKDYITLFPDMFGPAVAARKKCKPKLIAMR